ncbi:MAG: uridine kinase family protein [Leadbetterella sp.]
MKKPYIVGISGGSGSGKTSVLKALVDYFQPEDVCILSQDNYYKSIDLIQKDENGIENFDVPETIDFDLFEKHIHYLLEGKKVLHQEYMFNNSSTTPKALHYEPSPIILVEGLFVFYSQLLTQKMDLKVFVDCKEHLQMKRRVLRDNIERGYDLHDVLYRWEHHIAPSFEKYILPGKFEADIVLSNHTNCKKGVEVLAGYLKSLK